MQPLIYLSEIYLSEIYFSGSMIVMMRSAF